MTTTPTEQPAAAGCAHRHYPGANPWFVRNADGTVTGTWPEGVDCALVSRELLDGLVENMNTWTEASRKAAGQLAAARNDLKRERAKSAELEVMVGMLQARVEKLGGQA